MSTAKQFGRFTLILGPMGAGKSSYLLREIDRYAAVDCMALAINHEADTRSGSAGCIATHSGDARPAVALGTLESAMCLADYSNSTLIVINEAQFFPDPEQIRLFLRDGKDVVAASLAGDTDGRPIGCSSALVPMADKIVHLTALCKYCTRDAPFTARKDSGKACVDIGGMSTYTPVCRIHWEAGK